MTQLSHASTAAPSAATADAVVDFRPDPNQVLIRMYGQGLGDCFLLAFPPRSLSNDATTDTARPVYVLIDCGVVAGTPNGPDRMRAIVSDIRKSTQDNSIPAGSDGEPKGHLDLLIITHEHWDHLSGFVQAETEWNEIEVEALWTAWTENENDPSGLPDALKKILAKQQRALAAFADRAMDADLSEQQETVRGLMAFLAGDAPNGMGFSAAPTVGDAFAAAKALVAKKDKHTCCEPGQLHRIPGTDSIAYVLGPPRSDELLRKVAPSKKSPETYEADLTKSGGPEGKTTSTKGKRRKEASVGGDDSSVRLRRLAVGPSAFNSFVTPLLGTPRAVGDQNALGDAAAEELCTDRDLYNRSFPFAQSFRIPLASAEAATRHYPEPAKALASYYHRHNSWRRIDSDWLVSAENFALQADNLTNNTSLVLAIELPAGAEAERKVLLFVGDAQVGNWLSWDEIPKWLPQEDARTAQASPDVGDLLQRTVFYKVGHHGSHNATLKALGVERMRDDGTLTAFVPVSVEVARHLKDWCAMPLDVMLNALKERTGNRVVLPNGNVWPPVEDPDQLKREYDRIGIEVSLATLEPKLKDGKPIEGAVPLWVQLSVDY
ncbi:MAG: hypothetical protein QOF33_994 [Thermomicrobiales bacterium]|nr:hypothetical protein [Thermomicrobiales bacterium]